MNIYNIYIVFFASCVWARTLTGVVYSHDSGASGRGTGTIEFGIGEEVYELRYQKPLVKRFNHPACDDLGAIWSVLVKDLADREAFILSVECRGQLDDSIHKPWLVVREFLSNIAEKRFEKAASLILPGWRSSPEYEDVWGVLSRLKMDKYQEKPDGRCLQVVNRSGSIRCRLECGVRNNGKFVEMLFSMVELPDSLLWKINRIEIEE